MSVKINFGPMGCTGTFTPLFNKTTLHDHDHSGGDG